MSKKARRRRVTKNEAPPNRLLALREAQDWRQSDVAQFLGISEALICRLEKGQRRLTEDTIKKFALLYRVESHALFNNVYADGEVGALDKEQGDE